jgi:methionine salvage enolase-phosphatase E1
LGRDFNEYLFDVYGTSGHCGALFDAFMVFYSLGRIPDHLYSMLHSSQESATAWQMTNSAGVINSAIDALVNTVKYSLDADVIETAAKDIQEKLYNPVNDYA